MFSPLKIYLTFRKPKNFLAILVIFIVFSMTLHTLYGYDSDFGVTNLVLSMEASIAGAVLMLVAEQSAEMHRRSNESQAEILKSLVDMQASQAKTLKGVLLIAESHRDMLKDHTKLLEEIDKNTSNGE
jgi:uncharacterized membrane protein